VTDALDLRPATPDDVPTLLAFVQAAYRGDSARRGWTHEADLVEGARTTRDELLDHVSALGKTVLTARRDDELVGCVHVAKAGEDGAYLGLLSVRPDLQGMGLGKRLVAAAEAHARSALRARRMEMTVIRQRPELIAWYERLGYRPTGEERPFPYDDPTDVPTRPDLVFLVLEKAL
jgi:ribosomal protein S18 acetylase RimI-like enzyme